VRPPLPPILCEGSKVKVATSEGLDCYKALIADGLTHAQADAIVYHPDNRGRLYLLQSPIVDYRSVRA
jgi:hypothetical protein